MNLADVRTNLAAAVAAANPGMDAYGYVPDTIVPPTFVVGRMAIQFDQTFGGLMVADVTCHILASRADTQQGQDTIIPLLAPTGLKATIEADKTLSGACSELNVPTADGPGLVEMAGQQYWGATITVRVWG